MPECNLGKAIAAVDCPACGAKAGSPCTADGGSWIMPGGHDPRMELWRDQPAAPDPEPKMAEMPQSVRIWLDFHPDAAGETDEGMMSREDLTDDVRAFLAQRIAWKVVHTAWRERQPIDFRYDLGMSGGAWRMFGGPWIRIGYQYEETNIPIGNDTYVRVTESPIKAAQDALARLGRERFREWAQKFYDLNNARAAAQVAFTMHLREGAGRPPL